MHTKKLWTVAAAAAVVLLAGGAEAQENPPTAVYDNWGSGNAGAECAAIGNYVYAYKFNEGSGEGAPNESETAQFFDLDGNLVHSNTITISSSDGSVFDWSSDPNSIGAVIVKAGTGANVWIYDPQQTSDTGLYAYLGKEISHVTFCWNLDEITEGAEWCSPGYWRQPQHLDSWEATGYETDEIYSVVFGDAPTLSKLGVREGAPTDPTLLQVLQNPQWYGGDAFNVVGDLLSDEHPDVNFTGERVEDSCPLS